MTTVSKIFLEEFIEIFESQPSLWKSKSDEFKNKNIKLKSWELLVEKYKEIDKNANIEIVKKKINALKTTYRRELLKVIKSEKSGAGADDVYIPSLWYFDSLNFLRDQEEQAEGINTIDIENMERPAKRRKNDVEENFLKTATEYFQMDTNQTKRDESDIFGEGWSSIFRKLDPTQQIYAKRIIDEALMRGQLGKLTFMSEINEKVPEQSKTPIHKHINRKPIYLTAYRPTQLASSSEHSRLSFSPDAESTTYLPPSPSPSTQYTDNNVQIISNETVVKQNSFQEFFNSYDIQ